MTTIAYKISGMNRKRKFDEFLSICAPTASTTILDVGFSDEEYSATDNYLEKNYAHPENITALGINKPVKFPQRYPMVKVVQYDGKTFPFKDNAFDIVWSNAVIEHVGPEPRQVQFLKEINRVAKQRVFITTPNKLFPVEVHTRTPFLHWLPKKAFDRYLHLIGKQWAAGDYMYLITISRMKRMLAEAGITDYTIIKNRLCGLVLDYVVTW
ncbi:MAG: methyltransferase domain-containing protein [Candidatus Auribacterota bacterium]